MSMTKRKTAIVIDAADQSRKRRRLEALSKKGSNKKPSLGQLPAIFSANELAWKEVTPPEWLDDAEGFFGLEEIDDIEVVHDAKEKQITFRKSYYSEPARADTTCLENEVLDIRSSQFQDDEEWDGFTDQAEIEFKGSKEHKREQQSRLNASKETIHEKLPIAENENYNPFGVLGNEDENDGVDISEWSKLPLSNTILAALSSLGFARPSPIQKAVIPQVLEGHDVIGKAVTGSGKTLAFAIPIYENWLASTSASHSQSSRPKGTPISLILTPTRELAHQVSKHFKDLVERAEKQPRIITVTGGLSIHKQQRQLVDADIVIGTPGRLWEVMNGSQGLLDGLKHIKFLVIDEADRLLSEGHFEEVEEILNMLDRHVLGDEEVTASRDAGSPGASRQTLVFSATFHKGLQRKLASRSRPVGGDHLTERQSMDYLLQKLSFREGKPIFVDVNPISQMAQRLKESLVECSAMEKDIYLYSILIQRPRAKTLVFTNSISSVRRLTPILQNLNLPVTGLHSSMPQKARLRSIERFSEVEKRGNILIATDVAARGLDIPEVDLVLHYHVPRTADAYIHRSGRTARAENSGESILLCSPDEGAGVTKLIAQVQSPDSEHHLQSIHVDRRLVTRLLPRLTLSQKIAGATLAKEKVGLQDEWLRTAAEDLGVDYDSEEFAVEGAKNSRGRGAANREKQKIEGSVSKVQVSSWRSQLKDLLAKHVNLGVSEKYLAGGGVDVDAMLDSGEKHQFLKCRLSSD